MGFRKYPHFNIAISRREGDKTWVLRAAIDSDIFDSLVRSVHLGKSGDAFILSTGHVLQTKPRFGHDMFDTLSFPDIPRFPGTRVEEFATGGQTSLFAMRSGWAMSCSMTAGLRYCRNAVLMKRFCRPSVA